MAPASRGCCGPDVEMSWVALGSPGTAGPEQGQPQPWRQAEEEHVHARTMAPSGLGPPGIHAAPPLAQVPVRR